VVRTVGLALGVIPAWVVPPGCDGFGGAETLAVWLGAGALAEGTLTCGVWLGAGVPLSVGGGDVTLAFGVCPG
jgi:hypothetical protein